MSDDLSRTVSERRFCLLWVFWESWAATKVWAKPGASVSLKWVHLRSLGRGRDSTHTRRVHIQVWRKQHLGSGGSSYKGQGLGVRISKSVPRAAFLRAVKSLALHFKESIHDSSNCLPLFFISSDGKSILCVYPLAGCSEVALTSGG